MQTQTRTPTCTTGTRASTLMMLAHTSHALTPTPQSPSSPPRQQHFAAHHYLKHGRKRRNNNHERRERRLEQGWIRKDITAAGTNVRVMAANVDMSALRETPTETHKARNRFIKIVNHITNCMPTNTICAQSIWFIVHSGTKCVPTSAGSRQAVAMLRAILMC